MKGQKSGEGSVMKRPKISQNVYSSRNNIRMIKSRKVRWVGDVACMGSIRS
jgi:uncharacterized protein YceK